MATVTGLTADRMLEIEAAAVVGGTVDVDGHLILEKHDGTFIDAGYVTGEPGTPGAPGTPAPVTTFIRDPTPMVDIPSSFGMGLTVGQAGSDMPFTYGTVETVRININRSVQRVTDKESGRVVWRTAIADAWSPWRFAQERGSTGDRNLLYGNPSTDAEIAALANLKPIWFNTDFGWHESYYAANGTVGATVPTLFTGAPSGWYPLGNEGPQARLYTNGTQAHSSNTEFSNWKAFTPSGTSELESWRTGTQISRTSSYLETTLWGRYDIEALFSVPPGSGTGVLGLAAYRPSITGNAWDEQVPVTLMGSYGQYVPFHMNNQIVRPDDHIFIRTVAASWTVGGGHTFMTMRYVGPPVKTV